MKSIELFAGAGGLALATANAGFHHEAVFEWNSNACATLRRNKDGGLAQLWNAEIIEGDIASVNFTEYAGKVDFVSGGPPCQPFSIGGKHVGMDDERNMFPHAIRAVREIAPKAFIFENVKGLLRENFADYYAYIIQQLTFPELLPKANEGWRQHLARLEKATMEGPMLGPTYRVKYQLLDAANYGVPQHRHRVLIVGVRSDVGGDFAFPLPTHQEDGLLHDMWVTASYWERHSISKKHRPTIPAALRRRVETLRSLFPDMLLPGWRTVRDAISDLPALAPGASCCVFANHFCNPGARAYPGHDGSPYDRPAKALKAGDHGVPGGENTLRFEDGTVRYFSVRECARLQTFPDNWIFEGSWTEAMRQLGNAVPVQMCEIVAGALKQSLVTGNQIAYA